ncbi:hypothetical protein [Chryseobacterium sp. BIGb0232]|uniref:hypothetical protein n=1 Tax=Chryseobacterium sp. BIGb0232 TaxID=2940598 RepID=UPI000F4A3180|nr:hypothetical protein [Chryseobacterium sp. BIGb0232]MCS4302399.1 hypothetical protein [Chryseobacterium sp. BIGb0232]ROS18342.1 hypothetical protein EDF65_2736 [Chryseobacterium nakagawai]
MKSQLNQIWALGDTEIDLFRKMSNILSIEYGTLFIEETHQHRICFDSNVINEPAYRELSDLWIIAYSPIEKRIRMTFLQAKYHRKNLLPSRIFHGDYFQYELLSTRPLLTHGSSFNFPANILKFDCCDSVGSYGVFYIDYDKKIDMAYCCASQLTADNEPTSYRQFFVNLSFPPITVSEQIIKCRCNICSELNYTFDIDIFTENLLELNIGAEVLQEHFDIISFLKFFLQRNLINENLNQLLDLINDDFNGGRIDGNDFFKSEGGNPHILLINVDGKYKNGE